MLAELKKERASEQSKISTKLTKFKNENSQITIKLDRLLDLQLEGGLSFDDYKKKKNELVDQNIDLEQKIAELQQLENNWLEPMKDFIKASSQTKKSVNLQNNNEVLSSLKNVGSNFILKDKKFNFAPKIGWRALAEGEPTKTFPNWRCLLVKIRTFFDENPDCEL